jgi:hypothetical protein
VLVICSAVAPHTISSLVGRTENLLVRILVWYVCRDLETVALVNSTEIEIHRDVDLIISGIGSHLKCTLCVGRRCATAGKNRFFLCFFNGKSAKIDPTEKHRSVFLHRYVGSKIGSDRCVHDAHFCTDFFSTVFRWKKVT